MKYDKVQINKQTYFRYRYWDPNFKKYVKTLYSKSLKGLKEKYKEYNILLNAGIIEEKTTFNEYFENWLYTVHLIDKKPSTKTRYDSTYRTHIKNSMISDIPIQKITTNDLQKFYNNKFDSHNENIVKSIHKIINPCIRYAFENNTIQRNFTLNIKLPKDMSVAHSKKRRVHPLTLKEQLLFVKEIEGNNYETLYNMALDTGIRQGELFALTWEDIDFKNESINIDKTFSCVKDIQTDQRKKYITNTKTYMSTRRLPLPQRIKGLLLKHYNKQKTKLLKMGIIQNQKSLVFSSSINTELDSGNVLTEIKKVFKRCNIDTKTFHDLRHTYATRLFELGEPAKTVQELLGHSTINITLDTYTHVLEDQKTKTATLIDLLYNIDETKIIKTIG